MIRQARTYLVGAMSGASLIAIAIAVFVLLVSTQVFDWPVAGLLGGGEQPSVSNAKEAAAPAPAAGPGRGAAEGGAKGGGDTKGAGEGGSGGGSAAPAGGEGGAPAGAGEGEGGPGATGGEEGDGPAPVRSGGSSGDSGGGNGSGGGSGGTATSTPSQKATGAAKETVTKVDEDVTGGALEETGVTHATEEAVNGVAGPESTAGKAVDETAKTVEGVTRAVEGLDK
jgi:hypothetical protein